jgi:hypothetical protein
LTRQPPRSPTPIASWRHRWLQTLLLLLMAQAVVVVHRMRVVLQLVLNLMSVLEEGVTITVRLLTAWVLST